ncbi:hypothetical protein GCM10020255_018520 [Rhodococcus baikonurensis]
MNSAEHTGVYLDLKVQTPHELQVGVLDDRIDVAIGAFASPMTGLTAQALHREQHWLYCSDKHPLFASKRVHPDVITRQRMVTRVIGAKPNWLAKDSPRDQPPSRTWKGNSFSSSRADTSDIYPSTTPDTGSTSNDCAPLPASFGYQAPFSLIYRRGRARTTGPRLP